MVDWKKPIESLHHHGKAGDPAVPHTADEAPVVPATETGVAYEKEDVSPTAIMRLGIVLVASSIAIVGASYGLFRLFQADEARGEPEIPPLARREAGRLPPEPRLQTTPMGDLASFREDDRRRLDSYGWVDKGAGTVHIKVEDAMRLYMERAGASAGRVIVPPTASTTPNDASAPWPPGAARPMVASPAPSPQAAASPFASPAGGHH